MKSYHKLNVAFFIGMSLLCLPGSILGLEIFVYKDLFAHAPWLRDVLRIAVAVGAVVASGSAWLIGGLPKAQRK